MGTHFCPRNSGITPLPYGIKSVMLHWKANWAPTHRPELRPGQNLQVPPKQISPVFHMRLRVLPERKESTLYNRSCPPAPQVNVQSSPGTLPCTFSCKPSNHFISLGRPGVGPYCNASSRSLCLSVNSRSGSVPSALGVRAVKEKDVMGNASGLGLPISREMIPGIFSSGRMARTGEHQYTLGSKGQEPLTWTR